MATRKPPQRKPDLPDPFATPPAQSQLAIPDATGVTTNHIARKEQAARIYKPLEQTALQLQERHAGVLTTKIVVTAENLKATKTTLQELVKFRTSLEDARKAEKEESLRYGQLVDNEAKRIAALVAPVELVYKDAISAFETADEARRVALLRRIAELRETPKQAIGKSVEVLQQMLEAVVTFPLAEMQEFREQAVVAQESARQSVAQLLKDAQAAAEAARLNVIRDRIENLRKAAAQARAAQKAATLERLITMFEQMNPANGVNWGELFDEAVRVYTEELAGLRELLATKRQADEQARLIAERELENAALRQRLEDSERREREAEEARERADRQRQQETVRAAGGSFGIVGASPASVGAMVASMKSGDTMDLGPVEVGTVITQELVGERFGEYAGRVADEAAARHLLPADGLVRMENVGRDEHGNMLAELVPAKAGEAGTMRVLDNGDGSVDVLGMAVPTEFGLMPEPPSPTEMVDALAEAFDDHPLNIISYLEAMDFQQLRNHYGQPSLNPNDDTTEENSNERTAPTN